MLLERIKLIVDNQFIYEGELSASTRVVEDLGADSFDIPVLMNALEDEFSLAISTQDITTIRTIGDLLSIIQSRLER